MVLGGLPDAVYPVTVTGGGTSEIITVTAAPAGTCDPNDPPYSALVLKGSLTTDAFGRPIDGGQTSVGNDINTIPLTTRMYLVREREKSVDHDYKAYEGNRHDSKVFFQIMDDMFRTMRDLVGEGGTLRVIFDKGMNSEENIAAIDGRDDINFITTYSTYFTEHLVHVDLENFTVVDTRKNRKLAKAGKKDDQLQAWRTQGEYWGRERTVVVTYNPLTATKQRYGFEKKMLRLQETLFEFQSKVANLAPYWRKQSVVLKRYKEICSELHIPSDLYKVELYHNDNRLRMNFRKNHYRISRYIDRFGKNIIITDITDWTTDEMPAKRLPENQVLRIPFIAQ